VSIVNAVRIATDKKRRWVLDASSIATYGRWEGVLEAADAGDDNYNIDRIGGSHLATRSTPASSIVVQAVPDGLTFSIGDFVEVDGEQLRCVGITRRLNANGDWDLIPEFETLDELARKDAGRVADRLIRRLGEGSPIAAPVRDGSTRSSVQKGRIGDFGSEVWSWTDLADIEPGDWQVWNVDSPCRITDFRVDADYFEVVDDEAEQVAYDTTRLTFTVNGSPYDPQPTLELGITESEDEVPIWGSAVLRKGDKIRIRLLADGGHINGSVRILYTGEP
jgi:hypothetical protein